VETIVIDNIIPTEVADRIQETVLGSDFPWYLNQFTACQRDYESGVDHKQFTHGFYWDGVVFSDWFDDIVLTLMQAIPKQNVQLLRAKSNLVVPQPKGRELEFGAPHVDDLGHEVSEFAVCLYYVNDSDGDTVIYNEKSGGSFPKSFSIKQTISPKKGRMVLFDGKHYHSGGVPEVASERCVVNINFCFGGGND
jgi:hypothetical protein